MTDILKDKKQKRSTNLQRQDWERPITQAKTSCGQVANRKIE